MNWGQFIAQIGPGVQAYAQTRQYLRELNERQKQQAYENELRRRQEEAQERARQAALELQTKQFEFNVQKDLAERERQAALDKQRLQAEYIAGVSQYPAAIQQYLLANAQPGTLPQWATSLQSALQPTTERRQVMMPQTPTAPPIQPQQPPLPIGLPTPQAPGMPWELGLQQPGIAPPAAAQAAPQAAQPMIPKEIEVIKPPRIDLQKAMYEEQLMRNLPNVRQEVVEYDKILNNPSYAGYWEQNPELYSEMVDMRNTRAQAINQLLTKVGEPPIPMREKRPIQLPRETEAKIGKTQAETTYKLAQADLATAKAEEIPSLIRDRQRRAEQRDRQLDIAAGQLGVAQQNLALSQQREDRLAAQMVAELDRKEFVDMTRLWSNLQKAGSFTYVDEANGTITPEQAASERRVIKKIMDMVQARMAGGAQTQPTSATGGVTMDQVIALKNSMPPGKLRDAVNKAIYYKHPPEAIWNAPEVVEYRRRKMAR